jgi:type VI secretion system protein ImpA
MSATPLAVDNLLDPVPVAGMPAGIDMRWTPEWDRIKEARRFDDGLETGRWQKRDRKTADWTTVQQLTTDMLRDRTKDLQLSMWLTEANIKLYGFAGLRDGFRVSRELMARYWDDGLFPSMEDGPDDRSGPFEWLNSKLVDSIRAIPITNRAETGRDYSFIDLADARRTGSEKSFRKAEGEFDPIKKRAYDEALAEGHISLEMFERAVADTESAAYEELAADFQQAWEEFKALEKTVDEKFGLVAPNLAACRNALDEMKQAVSDILANKRKTQPNKPATKSVSDPEASRGSAQSVADRGESITMRFPLSISNSSDMAVMTSGSWQEAENLIRSGQTEKGLAEMIRLAASETTGRSRFHRKLLLAEVCMETQRDRLAKSILEELAEQIDRFQLEHWESSELISGVWSQLYRIYKRSGDSDFAERAGKLYERLCRLDPWQALNCGDV